MYVLTRSLASPEILGLAAEPSVAAGNERGMAPNLAGDPTIRFLLGLAGLDERRPKVGRGAVSDSLARPVGEDHPGCGRYAPRYGLPYHPVAGERDGTALRQGAVQAVQIHKRLVWSEVQLCEG